jgi:hypothetical protein
MALLTDFHVQLSYLAVTSGKFSVLVALLTRKPRNTFSGSAPAYARLRLMPPSTMIPSPVV